IATKRTATSVQNRIRAMLRATSPCVAARNSKASTVSATRSFTELLTTGNPCRGQDDLPYRNDPPFDSLSTVDVVFRCSASGEGHRVFLERPRQEMYNGS